MRLTVAAAFLLAAAIALPAAFQRASADGPSPAADATRRPFPVIAVGATSELAIAPDEAWIHLGVDSFFAAVDTSVADNDKRIGAILVVLRAAGIDPADMSTTTMSLAETDRYEDDQRKVHGWQVSRSLVARVRDLASLEKLLQKIVSAGATQIRDVRFSHSKLADKKGEARVAAMAAARNKAQAMAGALGQRIGQAVAIREGGAGQQVNGFSDYMNAVVNGGGAPLEGQTIAAGQIRIEVSVAVDFELL